MGRREEIEKRTEVLTESVLADAGCELYDIEYVKEGQDFYLRVFIDKEGGVTIGDCETVSRALSDLLDKEDFIKDAYIFEVSSPGLGRVLKKDRHLEKSLGDEVEISTYKKIDGNKEFRGILAEFTPDTIIIEEENGEKRTLLRADISRIRLALDF